MSVLTVLEKLSHPVEKEVNLILNSKQEADTLRYKLKRIEDGLQDAERRGVTELDVKSWLKELEDVMYEIDDALDKWETKNLEQQIEQSEYDDISDPWEKVRSLFMSLCLSFKRVVGRRGLTLEMKALSANLDKILEERGKYNFAPNTSDKSRELKKPEITSAVDESNILYGRESDKNSLVKLLLSKGEQKGSGQVISIVGVGGLGKTTLAQLVFNDPRVKGHFGDLKAWVSVPNPFDSSKVAKAIVESFDKSSSSNTTLENLGQRIKAAVSKQKNFLLVLDDVWTVDRTEWESLKNFLVGEPGCRILVTTRDEEAAKTMGTTHWPRLNVLSDLDCAAILNTIALEGRSSEGEYKKFCEIGFKIAEKCKGLPLAAKTLGHMLGSRFIVREWEDVLESPLWKYEDEMSDVFYPLRLSYMDLSPILKRCFLSCVLYSRGPQFDVDELIGIWMAQGYISSSGTWEEVQSKGMRYVQKLFMRSFFQELEMDESEVTCKMHDVMLEFANYLARSEHYFILDNRTRDIKIESIERTRYFCARSFSQENLPPNFLRLQKCVRVLCLSNCNLEKLSEEVGELIHLRYLDLSENPMEVLPETVCNLCNLQTLALRSCHDLSRLPNGLGKLMNLRHLLLRPRGISMQFPPGLEKLRGLWTLDENFRATGDSVGYLRNLNQLRGSLKIRVEDLTEAAEAEKANLRNKNHIQELELLFFNNVSNDVIEVMVPPPQLQTLYILGGFNHQVPSWMTTTSSLNNLKALTVDGFNYCSDSTPALGKLPMLETLCINGTFKRLGLEFLGIIPKGTTRTTAVVVGGFPKLKTLRFTHCYFWEEWEDMLEDSEAVESVPINMMPCLQELRINRCSELKALPHNLLHSAKSLHKLIVRRCRCLESRYGPYGRDRNKISHIPDTYFF